MAALNSAFENSPELLMKELEYLVNKKVRSYRRSLSAFVSYNQSTSSLMLVFDAEEQENGVSKHGVDDFQSDCAKALIRVIQLLLLEQWLEKASRKHFSRSPCLNALVLLDIDNLVITPRKNMFSFVIASWIFHAEVNKHIQKRRAYLSCAWIF